MSTPGPDDRYVDPLTGRPIAPPDAQYQRPAPYFGGYEGAPGYQGFGMYPGGPGGPQRKRTGLVIGVVALILLVGGGIAALLLVNSGDDTTPTASGATASRSTAPQSPTRSTTRSSAPPITVAPVIPGWQSVAAADEKVAYDVPADWEVESPGTLVGFEDSSGPRATMHAVATYKPDACPESPGSYRAHSGFMKLIDRDPQSLAAVAAKFWAEAAAEKPQDDPSVPQPPSTETTIANGGKAWTATATITPAPSGECDAPTMKITTVAFTVPGGTGSALFVLYADQQVPDTLPDAVTAQIISSLRPAN